MNGLRVILHNFRDFCPCDLSIILTINKKCISFKRKDQKRSLVKESQ